MHSSYSISAKATAMTIDPKSQLFKRIYINLLFRAIAWRTSYHIDNLDDFLHGIGANRQDLVVDRIEDDQDEYLGGDIYGNGYVEYQLPLFTKTYYRPICHIQIEESTSYRQNVFYRICKEYTAYNYTLPGISIDEFTTYLHYDCKREDVEEAFIMALKSGLIKPIMCKTRSDM
jgi:hypothetical protein